VQNSGDTVRVDAAVLVSSAPDVAIDLPAVPSIRVEAAAFADAARIPFHSDHSPPIWHSLPDSERAPPVR
jgi:hypothetical protein